MSGLELKGSVPVLKPDFWMLAMYLIIQDRALSQSFKGIRELLKTFIYVLFPKVDN